MPAHRTVWCAANDWSVGGNSGTNIDGYIVSVVRWSPLFNDYYMNKLRLPGRPFKPQLRTLRRGELNGQRIPNTEEARAEKNKELALRGYLVPFRRRSFWTREQWETYYAARLARS